MLVVGCLILGGKIGYDYYMGECEQYNDNIVNFTIEMIKGNKSLEDVDSLDATDEVKESLQQYYNDTFYSDDDLILIYEDVEFLNRNIDMLVKFQESYLKDGILSEEYMIDVFEEYSNEVSYAGEDINEEQEPLDYKNEEKIKKLYSIFDITKQNNTSDNIIIKENKLYINSKDISLQNGRQEINYQGYIFNLFEGQLNKKVENDIKQSEKYQSIELKNTLEEDNYIVFVLKDYLNNKYTFKGSMKFGKLVNIEF